MDITCQIITRVADISTLLKGKKIGVYPADFGRFSSQMSFFLNGLNIVGLYHPSNDFNHQGYPIFNTIELFLDNIDICLSWGKDPFYTDTLSPMCTIKKKIPIIDLFDVNETNSLLYNPQLLQIFDYNQPNPTTISTLKQHDINTKNIKAIMDMDGLWEYSVHQQIDFIPFDKPILTQQKAQAPCPVCGKLCQTNRSFVLTGNYFGGVVFFKFHCHDDFFILKKWENLMGIYLPKKNIFIKFRKMKLFATKPDPDENYRNLIDQFHIYIIYYFSQTLNYLTNKDEAELQCIAGYQGSFGHYLQSETTAIHNLIAAKNQLALKNLLVTDYDPFNIPTLFPELPNVKRITGHDGKRNATSCFHTAIDNNYISLFLYTFAPLSEQFAKRIYHCCQTTCQDNQRLNNILDNLHDHWPVIWITLKTGQRRNWSHQEQCIANILKALYTSFPNLIAVFDGVPSANGLLEQQKNLLNKNIPVQEALDFSVEETIILAHHIDFFITFFGTPLNFVAIANKPGIIHSNKEMFEDLFFPEPDGKNYHWPRENCAQLIAISGENEDSHEADPRLRNYSLNGNQLMQYVNTILSSLSEDHHPNKSKVVMSQKNHHHD